MFLVSNGTASTPQVSAPTATTPLPVRYLAPSTPSPGSPAPKRLSSLPIRLSQPVWKITTSPWRDFDVLLLGDFLDLLDVEGGAFLDHVGTVMRGHVEQHAARHHRRDLLDAELLQPGGIGEFEQLVAVVINVLDADMAEAVELAADADPAFDDVVIIGGLAGSEARNTGLAGLHDRDLESPRRI